MSDLDLEAGDLIAPDFRATVEVSARDSLTYFDVGVDSLDRIAEVDRDGGDARSEFDGSARDARGALEPVLLALIVLKALLDQDRERRLRSLAPASAA